MDAPTLSRTIAGEASAIGIGLTSPQAETQLLTMWAIGHARRSEYLSDQRLTQLGSSADAAVRDLSLQVVDLLQEHPPIEVTLNQLRMAHVYYLDRTASYKEVLSDVLRSLLSVKPAVISAGLELLTAIGSEPLTKLPIPAAFLAHPHYLVRLTAIESIRAMQPPAAVGQELVSPLASDPDPLVRQMATSYQLSLR